MQGLAVPHFSWSRPRKKKKRSLRSRSGNKGGNKYTGARTEREHEKKRHVGAGYASTITACFRNSLYNKSCADNECMNREKTRRKGHGSERGKPRKTSTDATTPADDVFRALAGVRKRGKKRKKGREVL